MPTYPWNKQPKETAQAFEAFATYRDMGYSRSLAKVAKVLGKSAKLMGDWSGKWNWVKRTGLWDSWMDAKAQEAAVDEAQEASRRHIRLAKNMQGIGALILKDHQRVIQKAIEQGKNISINIGDGLKLVIEGAKLERAALELPETVTRNELTGPGGEPIIPSTFMQQFEGNPAARDHLMKAIENLDGFESVPDPPYRKKRRKNGTKANGTSRRSEKGPSGRSG